MVSFKVVPLALEPPAPRELKRDPRQFSDAKRRASPHFPKASGLVDFDLHVLRRIFQFDMPIPGIVQTSRPWPGRSACRAHGLAMFRASLQALGLQSEWSIRFVGQFHA